MNEIDRPDPVSRLSRGDLLVALAAAVIAAAVYSPALGIGLFSDDLTWAGKMAPTLERPSYLLAVFGRDLNPVMHLSLLMDWLMGGGRAWAFHASSWLIHLLAVAGLAVLTSEISGSRWAGLAAALTWGLNVRLSEAVIWPAARGHCLATLWVLAALIGLRYRLRLPFVGALVVLALLSKETALFAILLLPLLVPKDRPRRPVIIMTVGLAAAFALLNLAIKPGAGLSHETLGELVLKAPFLVLRPIGLASLYGFSWPDLAAWAVAGLAVAILLRRCRPALVGLAWALLTTAPIVLLPKLSSRYLYLPAIGYAICLASVLGSLSSSRFSRPFRQLSGALAALLVGLLLVAGSIRIQREIADYDLLSRPFIDCLEALEPAILQLSPGDTLVVWDASPRDAHVHLMTLIAERGTMLKLIPARADAVGGLVYLEDAINIVKPRTPGALGSRVVAGSHPEPVRALNVLYDGTTIHPLRGAPHHAAIPRLAAHWGDASLFFETRRE